MRRHGRGAGVGRSLGVGVGLGVELAVGVAVGVGEAVGVGVGLGAAAQYLPPVFKPVKPAFLPPHTIILISLSAQTVACSYRASGGFVVLVATQLSVLGLYLPPVSSGPMSFVPPQTII